MLAKKINQSLTRFRDEEDGASAIEYGLFASLIAAVIVVTVTSLGQKVNTGLKVVDDALTVTAPEEES